MSMHIEIRPEPEFLNIHITGRFSLKEAQRTFLETLGAVAQHNTKKVMVDGRKLIGSPATIERFIYGKFAANSVKTYKGHRVSAATLFAYVLHEPVLDPHRFGETAAVNRGMHVRAFDNVDDAYKWLSIAPAK
jgi:hypothetical protein